MSFSVDHNVYKPDVPDDTSTDPEGAQQRAARPASGNAYVQDMMVYNERFNRWEPAGWFIEETARVVPKVMDSVLKQLKDDTPQDTADMLSMLHHAQSHLESGPYTGLLYGLKDLVLKQLCSVYIWMESNEAIRASRVNRGEDPTSDDVQKSEEAIEKNRVAFTYYARLLRALAQDNEGHISLNDFAWRNAAKQAAWDFLGYHKRQSDNPRQSSHSRAVRRTGEDLMMS